MHKNKSNQQKLKEHTTEKDDQTVSSAIENNQNQNHNAKKVSMGTNTKH